MTQEDADKLVNELEEEFGKKGFLGPIRLKVERAVCTVAEYLLGEYEHYQLLNKLVYGDKWIPSKTGHYRLGLITNKFFDVIYEDYMLDEYTGDLLRTQTGIHVDLSLLSYKGVKRCSEKPILADIVDKGKFTALGWKLANERVENLKSRIEELRREMKLAIQEIENIRYTLEDEKRRLYKKHCKDKGQDV